jgi:RNA polymerase sigma factor (sigma-70 family)
MPLPWDAFLARYAPMARAIARPLVRPPLTPEDVVQEASLALHRALARDPERFAEREHARNYFLRAVHNLACKSRRDARSEEAADMDALAVREEDPAVALIRARQGALAGLLAELAGPQRELLVRRFLEHQTLAGIAAETGTPISTLHDRERALLAGLRRRLDALDGQALDEESAP